MQAQDDLSPGRVEEVFALYLQGLRELLAGEGESAFAAAYAAGRLGIALGFGVLKMTELHQRAVGRLLGDGTTPTELAAVAGAYLAESLAPFEMVHRAVRETADRLTRSNEALAASATELRAANATIRTLMRERSAFLAEASRQLVASPEFDEIARTLARLPVPTLADWSTVEITRDSEVQRFAGTHVEPLLEPLIGRLTELPLGPESPQARVMRTGKGGMVTECEHALPASSEEQALVARLGAEFCLLVPLIARGRVLGTLTLVRGRRRGTYVRDDLALAEELAGRAALALDNARLFREARDAVQLRDTFLSIASHELRTPLTPLLMRMQMLGAKLRKADRPERPLAEKAVQDVLRLRRLVTALLDVSRIEAGKVTLERRPLALDELVREVGTTYETTSADHRFVFELEPGLVVEGDSLRLEQMLTNLFDNAVKYSPAGGEVRAVLRREGGEAVLSVSDQGIGIPAAQQSLLFQRFFRAENALPTSFGGLGLGLYLVRDIVERHGGRIAVESREGTGSTFRIRLPLAPAGAGQAADATAAPAEATTSTSEGGPAPGAPEGNESA